MSDPHLSMLPETGTGLVRFVGDTVRFELHFSEPVRAGDSMRARLRTTIGRGGERRREIRSAHFKNVPPAGRAWRDLEMSRGDNGHWFIELPLAEVGYFQAKAYCIDERGWLHWPTGEDVGINVQPNWCRTANTVYCAFPRMFGPNKTKTRTLNAKREAEFQKLEKSGYTVIPPSGTLRDLKQEVPHIFDRLGCRILHLLPLSPTPTTLAKFGRFGSPYALQDLTAIDPALIEFDQRTTGVQQFEELADEVHLRDGRVMLDLVINHTGWHSTLFEQHPEWFVRDEDGKFVSPGAWGTIWEDLVEIDPESSALWDELAEAFLVWCRRGVDGFRCDAGYKVPTLVWQYITARVHDEFPETVFLLEGLGGGWDDTAVRLTEGGMQWAYSELFQNYSAAELCGYLDHSWAKSEEVGLLVHYSETHDNDRLAKKGRRWSLLRNRLCALASVSGGFGFTNGVEWLATEQVNVHSSRGLSWGAKENIIEELAQLNRLLAGHECFFDGATLKRLSEPDDEVFAFERMSEDGGSRVLVLANLGDKSTGSFELPETWRNAETRMLIGSDGDAELSARVANVAAETVVCFELKTTENSPRDRFDSSYRDARARVAFALTSAHAVQSNAPAGDWRELAVLAQDPELLLAQVSGIESAEVYRPIVRWARLDQNRILLVPPGHWLLIRLPYQFRACLQLADGSTINLQSTPSPTDWFAAVPPQRSEGNASVDLKMFGETVERLQGTIRYVRPEPIWSGCAKGEPLNHWAAERTVLLTNGRGGMSRINLDLGRVRSKYDCVLGANLHDSLPVDRHVLVKRIRLWANADGFVVPLNAENLIWFGVDDTLPSSVAVWRFRVQAGNGRYLFVRVECFMTEGTNSVAFELVREQTSTTATLPLRLTARVDLEDRNFHWETKRNEAADHHFSSHTEIRKEGWGFKFQPAENRFVSVLCGEGEYHHAPEWSENLPHPVEASRGQTGEGDGWSPGWFDIPLINDGDAALLAVQTEPGIEEDEEAMQPLERGATDQSLDPELTQLVKGKDVDYTSTLAREQAHEKPTTKAFENRLNRAAEQFIVRRGDFKSVIAGYPWFLDWGRDTLICARGLISGGWFEEVKQLLIVFGRFEEQGTLPNTIHGADASNRDTSDAPLWYGVVAEELAEASDDSVYQIKVDQTRSVQDVLRSIAEGYIGGTKNGIHVDADSGLVWSPSHFTWMDTNYPAGTPREGYPIEIQALWIRLLRLLSRLGLDSSEHDWSSLAERASASIEEFYWLEEQGWYADSIVSRSGQSAANGTVDQALRSNCLIPISFGLLNARNARRCVEAARDYLVIPGGLRSLAPLPVEPPLPVHGNDGHLLNDPNSPYWGRYEGDEDTRRKPAYHNGTAWTWTFPTFCEALATVYDETESAVAAAKAYLGSVDVLMEEGCFGQIPEVLDGDVPHAQRGCDAQAWGVTESLRVWKKLNEMGESTPEN